MVQPDRPKLQMLSFLSKIFGGSKSDKDVKKLEPVVAEINNHFAQLQNLSNDQLRNKTHEFKSTIAEYLKDIDAEIAAKSGSRSGP